MIKIQFCNWPAALLRSTKGICSKLLTCTLAWHASLTDCKIKPGHGRKYDMIYAEEGTWTGQDIFIGPFLKFRRWPNLNRVGLESSTPSLSDAFEVLLQLWRLQQRQMPASSSWKTPRDVECRASHCPACWNAIKALKHTRAPATWDGKWKPPPMHEYNIKGGKTKWQRAQDIKWEV